MRKLQLLEIVERVNQIPGWFDENQMTALYPYALKAKNVVEIGTFAGKSTLFWALCNPEVNIITIDLCIGAPGHPVTSIQPEVVKQGNIIAIHENSHDLVSRFNRPIDLLFIDGSHEYEDVSEDIKGWLPKVRGVVACHDYPSWPGVQRAVDEHLKGKVILISDNHDLFLGKTL